MRVFVLTLLIFFFQSYKGEAQNTLSGKVTEVISGDPLPGVSIFIPEINKGVATDTLGNYTMKDLPAGRFLVEVNSFGYVSFNKIIEIKGSTVENIQLKESVAELDPVIITGVPSSTMARRNPIPTTTVTGEALLQNVSSNIVDAISKQPGVSQVTTGSAVSKPVIRGLGYNRVISLYNGVRQEGQQWGDEHGVEIDEYSIDRVEIVKGPGTLMYGSDGIGGVVNFITAKPVAEGEMRGSVLSNYQTNNHMIGYSIMNAGNIRKVEWMARVSSKHAGNYRNATDGSVFNSGFKESDFSAQIGTNRKWGYSQLYFTSFSQRIAMPEGNRDSLGNFTKTTAIDDTLLIERTVTKKDLQGYKISVPNQFIRHHRLLWTNNILFTNSSLRLTIAYQLNRRQEFGNIFQPAQYGLFFYLPTMNYDVRYSLPEYKGWFTSAGITGMYQQNQNRGIEFLIPDYHLFDIGSYIYSKKTFEKVTVMGGIRYDQRAVSAKDLFLYHALSAAPNDSGAWHKFSAFTNTYRNFSGSMGVTYEISSDVNIKANVARGYRAPNIAELSSNGRHEGSFRYEYGNSALKAETSLQMDGGISFSSDHITMEASVFNNSIQNYIYAVRLRSKSGKDSIVDPAEPVPTYQYGQNKAVLYGGEISLDIHPHPWDWLHFENSFSIVRGRNRNHPDSSRYLPFMPAPRYQSRVRTNLKKAGKHIHNVYIMVEAAHYFRQNQYLKENNTETATPGYTLVNGGAGGDITGEKGKVRFSVYISVNNIFNISYQNHLSRLKYAPVNPATGQMGIFNMGRNFSIKVLVPFGAKIRKE